MRVDGMVPVVIDAEATGVTDGKHAHAIRVVRAAAQDLREHRRAPLRDRALEHRGLERVDEYQDELRSHAGFGGPSYFWPSRRRRASSTQMQNATAT